MATVTIPAEHIQMQLAEHFPGKDVAVIINGKPAGCWMFHSPGHHQKTPVAKLEEALGARTAARAYLDSLPRFRINSRS